MGLRPRDITIYAYIPGSATQGDYYTTDDGLTTDTPPPSTTPLPLAETFKWQSLGRAPQRTQLPRVPSSLLWKRKSEARAVSYSLYKRKSTRVSSLSTRRQKVKLSTLSIREQSSPLLLRKKRQSARSPFPLSRRNQRTTSPSSLYSP